VLRPRRRRQAGTTLIEVVVTVGLVSASVVVLIGALGAVEKNGGLTSQQAHLQLVLRTLGDDLRSSVLVPYVDCTNGGSYRTALQGLAPTGVTVTSVRVDRPTSSGLTAQGCGGRRTDYGLQQLTLSVTDGGVGSSLVVFKSEATMAISGG
jgi:type II secretory pathway pseudopilin PulG